MWFFLISNSSCSLPAQRKAIDLCILSWYLVNLLYLLISFKVILLILWGFLGRELCHLLTKTVIFLPSQSEYLLFPFIVWLYYIASHVMLNRNCEKGYPCLVFDIEKISCFSPFSDNVICKHFLEVFFNKFPYISSFLWVFVMNGCFVFQMLVLHQLIYSFSSLAYWYDRLHWLLSSTPPFLLLCWLLCVFSFFKYQL